jgi:hypothetical protein
VVKETREEYLKRINSVHLPCPHKWKDTGDCCKCAFCGREMVHADDYMGVGGSGNYWVCRRCGRERDEYEGRVTD